MYRDAKYHFKEIIDSYWNSGQLYPRMNEEDQKNFELIMLEIKDSILPYLNIYVEENFDDEIIQFLRSSSLNKISPIETIYFYLIDDGDKFGKLQIYVEKKEEETIKI